MGGFAGRMTVLWTCIGSLPAEVLLHRGLGRRALGVDAVMAFGQMIAFICLFGFHFGYGPHLGVFYYDPTPLCCYLMLYAFALLGARITLWRRERRGEIEHSRYNGFPYLLPARLARFERSFKLIVEPSLVLVAGLKLWSWNMPLGVYVCFNAACMCWGNLINWRFDGRRQLDVRDAMIEQRINAQSLRGFTNRL
jgi:hypothetical protein